MEQGIELKGLFAKLWQGLYTDNKGQYSTPRLVTRGQMLRTFYWNLDGELSDEGHRAGTLATKRGP